MSETALLTRAGRAAPTAVDRCDRCCAQAYVRYRHHITGYVLDFCAHHAASHDVELGLSGFTVAADERADLRGGGAA